MVRRIGSFLLLACFAAGCARQATIVSMPPGAQVVVDGKTVGVTPCPYSYKTGLGSQYEIVVEKEGYEPILHQVKADEVDRKAHKMWLTAGAVWSPLWMGTFFTKKLKDNYVFVLKEAEPAQAQAEADDLNHAL